MNTSSTLIRMYMCRSSYAHMHMKSEIHTKSYLFERVKNEKLKQKRRQWQYVLLIRDDE